MSVRLSLLALLANASSYGYQLRAELDWRTGGAGPINVGQIYNTLDRLERDKLVRKTGTNNFYEITDSGRATVAEWFATPSPESELASKLALAATLPDVDVMAIIRAQRSRTAPVDATATPTSAPALASAIIAAAREAGNSCERELLERTEHLLELDIAPVPLSDEIPKRGRPTKPQN